MDEFIIANMAIAIIDTYVNDRVFIEQFAQKGSLQLNYDGGDDLYQPMMPSELQFSMEVTDNSDGKFLHLLTGDEKRYLVQLLNIDEEEIETIAWQGYILPDLYSEPYDNGVFFVSFTAIDMIASLKGKKMEPWFYYQKFNINILLGQIFSFTGLEQEIIVKPSLVNISLGTSYKWRDININMEPYYDGKKYTDLYDILTDILTVQGLQLFSFRGKWFLIGITRRAEYNGPAEVYNADGTFKENILTGKNVVRPYFAANAPDITAETPWKAVNLNFEKEEELNLYPEGLVVQDFYATRYFDDEFILPSFVTALMGYWAKQGAPYLVLESGKPYMRYSMFPGVDTNAYNLSEASALVNYIRCLERPYVAAGRVYELEIEVLVYFQVTFYGDIQWRIENGVFDHMLTFQLFINGIEQMSNRPSFPSSSLYKFEKFWYPLNDEETPGAAAAATWKLKRKFKANESGVVDFRFLPPLGTLEQNEIVDFYLEPKVLRINVIEKDENSESVRAVRDINYTRELDMDFKLTCSVDSSVKKSLGIAGAFGDFSQYFQNITIPELTFFIHQHEYLPITEVSLVLYRFTITSYVQNLLFIKGSPKKIFLQKPDGTKIHYFSMFTGNIGAYQYMVIYNNYTSNPFGGTPQLPDDYEPMALPEEGDILRFMHVTFPQEDLTKRALWKIFGFDDSTANSYLKTLAYAFHAVKHKVSSRIEGETKKLIFPMDVVQFEYDGTKIFIPTRLQLDLGGGKTKITMTEAVRTALTDIVYE